jgi:hypothetical protein
MDRYSIALNKHKKIPSPKSHEVQSFGFGSEPNYMESTSKTPRFYKANLGERVRVGIVYIDPAHMFTATNVHYHNRICFRCKSIEGHQEICCSSSRPNRRIICPIIIYGTSDTYREIVAWVFGNSAFRKLNELNRHWPLNANDFYLTRIDQNFDPWDIQPCPRPRRSLWQSSVEIKQRVLNKAAPIFNNKNNYLGRDLNLFEIRQLLAQPSSTPVPRNWQPRQGFPQQNRRPRQRREIPDDEDREDSLLTSLPNLREDRPDHDISPDRDINVDLDQLLENL